MKEKFTRRNVLKIIEYHIEVTRKISIAKQRKEDKIDTLCNVKNDIEQLERRWS